MIKHEVSRASQSGCTGRDLPWTEPRVLLVKAWGRDRPQQGCLCPYAGVWIPFGDPSLGVQAGGHQKPARPRLSPAQPALAQPCLLHHHSQAATQTCSASLLASKALAPGPSSLVSKPFPAAQSRDRAVPGAQDSRTDPSSAHPDLPKPSHSLGLGFPGLLSFQTFRWLFRLLL